MKLEDIGFYTKAKNQQRQDDKQMTLSEVIVMSILITAAMIATYGLIAGQDLTPLGTHTIHYSIYTFNGVKETVITDVVKIDCFDTNVLFTKENNDTERVYYDHLLCYKKTKNREADIIK